MERLTDFWDSGAAGKATILGVAALVILCCLCVALLAGLGAWNALLPGLLPAPGTVTATVTMTPTLGTAAGSAAPALTAAGAESTETPTPTLTPTPQPSSTAQPTAIRPSRTPKPAVTTGYTVAGLTSPIRRGRNVTLAISTVPNSVCNLVYVTPDGVLSTAPGLGQITASANGLCAWTWRIAANTPPGTGKLYITAGGVTGELNITIQ